MFQLPWCQYHDEQLMSSLDSQFLNDAADGWALAIFCVNPETLGERCYLVD